jgi:hypothetical protein
MSLEELAERVESSADWRAGKAKQYPNDKRNVHSSEALNKLAEGLRDIPYDDEGVDAYEAALDRALELDDKADVLSRISEFETQYLGRYGFDYPQDGNPSLFLEGLTKEIISLVEGEEAKIAEEENELKYEAAVEAADEAAKEAADEAAKEIAEEAAKEAAEEAYKEAYDEAYDEAYREALIKALDER